MTKEFSDYAILLAIGNDPIVTLAMNSNLSSVDSSTSSIPAIVLPHGGYKNLVAYKKSDVIYEGTVVFCRRFLPARGDRTVASVAPPAGTCGQQSHPQHQILRFPAPQRMKFVRVTGSSSGRVIPAALPAAMHLIIQAMFFASVRMI